MLERTDPAGPDRAVVLRALERGPTGRPVGELELGLFSAALIIDRSGVLEELVSACAGVLLAGPGSATLLGAGAASFAAGASGHRMDVVLSADQQGARPACPYISWLALASEDLALGGGVFATIRSAAASWDAASAMLGSLRITGLGGARGAGGPRLALPLVGRR